MSTVKDRLFERLLELPGKVLKARNGDNLGPVLGEIFVWQEVARYAKGALDSAWKAAVDGDIIDNDEVLRAEGPGEERILSESNSFSIIAKVDKPRKTFSRDKFIAEVARKFKLDRARLDALAETCMSESAAPLHKRVLEA
jgi:hypothetical protein